MSDSTSTPSAIPGSAPEGTSPAGGAPDRRVVFGILFALALAVRLAVLDPSAGATAGEADALAAARSAPLLPPRVDLENASVTLLALARHVAPAPRDALPVPEDLSSKPDPTIALARRFGAVLGALAAVLLALAANELGGRQSAIAAGGLMALSPYAVGQSVLSEPAGLLLFAASGVLLGLVRWSARPSVVRAAGTGVFAGLAAAAGGGGSALLFGVPWAARRDPAARVATLTACLITAAVALALAAPGILATGPFFPRGAAVLSPPSTSPLLAGLRTLAASAGWFTSALALVGVTRALTGSEAAPRAALAATAGLFLTTLVRSGAEPTFLAGAVPGLILLASLALAEPRAAGWALPVPRLFLVIAVAAAAWGSGTLAVGRWAPKPADAASDWIRRNVPNGAAVLLEEPTVRVATLDGLRAWSDAEASGAATRAQVEAYAAGGKTFGLVPLPPKGVRGREAALFYDPNLAQFFHWMVLRERAPRDATSRELTEVRGIFHEYFRSAWKQAVAFPSGLSSAPGLVVLERPEKFVLDRARLAPLNPLLGSPAFDDTRKASTPFTKWLKDAGIRLLSAGEVVGAGGFLQLATERDATDPEAHYQLALALMLRADNAAAKQSLLRTLDIDPFHGGAHYNLGIVLEDEGDTTGAETEYRAALQYLKAPAIAHARLGRLFFLRGDAATARAELDTVRQLDPGGEADRYLSTVLSAP